MQLNSVMEAKKPMRQDTAPDGKRVELHLHTKMSSMDALTDTKDAVKQAAAWGHRAIAITDHGVLQSFPDAMKAAKGTKVAGTDEDIKILYGCEAYFVNDVDDRIVVHGTQNVPLDGEFIAFDLETTGLSPENDVITEFGAVMFRNGEPAEHFQSFGDR
jgi:DNA polymerase-3 subunit alpha (Gram-positive type)